MSERAWMPIGIRLFKAGATESRNYPVTIGRQTEVYDLTTGRLIPIEVLDIHIDPDHIITANVRLEIYDIEIVETERK